jgi:hypothetical protein
MRRGAQVVGRPRNSSETGGPVGDASANRVRPRQRLSVARAALSDTASALRDPDAPNPRCMASGPRQSARHRTARATGKSLQRALASDGHDMAGGVTPRVCSAGLAAVLWACLAARTYMPTRPLLRFDGDRERTPRPSPCLAATTYIVAHCSDPPGGKGLQRTRLSARSERASERMHGRSPVWRAHPAARTAHNVSRRNPGLRGRSPVWRPDP